MKYLIINKLAAYLVHQRLALVIYLIVYKYYKDFYDCQLGFCIAFAPTGTCNSFYKLRNDIVNVFFF
jgi:hypothetical protein